MPTVYPAFSYEIVRPLRPWAKQVCTIQQWTPMPAAGHFAAPEEFTALADDLRTFFRA